MFPNCNKLMYNFANKKTSKWGKDQTGKITYEFDKFGFRSGNDYNQNPKYVFFGASYLGGIGVPAQRRFSSYFENSYNFGLMGKYTEDQTIQNYTRFLETFQTLCLTKIIFCWKEQNKKKLQEYINSLPYKEQIFHCVPVKFECDKKIKLLRIMQPIDYDVSLTHWGPKTHKKFSNILCHFLK